MENDELEEAWQLLNKQLYNGLNFSSEREVVTNIGNAFEKLNSYLEFDLYPPPEILLALNATYQNYLYSKGEINLEDAFFGKPQKAQGNFASRKAKSIDVHHLDLAFALNKFEGQYGNKCSQYEVAEKYLTSIGSDEDPEHLLRKWRRYRQPKKTNK
jgi:hypothetical protein